MQPPLAAPIESQQPAMVVQHPQVVMVGSPPPTRGKWFWGMIILGTILFLTTIIILGSYDPRDHIIYDSKEDGDTFVYQGDAIGGYVSVYTTDSEGCSYHDDDLVTITPTDRGDSIFENGCGSSGDAFEIEHDPGHSSGYDTALYLGEVELIEGQEYRISSGMDIILVDEDMVGFGGIAMFCCGGSWIAVLIIWLTTRSSRNAIVHPVQVIPQPVQSQQEQQ